MINLPQYWMGRDETYASELSIEILANATELLRRVNDLMDLFGQERAVRSGWRPAEVNASTPNAAPFSKHMTGQAVDLDDPEGDLDQWCLDNANQLARLGLWQEFPGATKGWTHLQCVPPKSGKRVFFP